MTGDDLASDAQVKRGSRPRNKATARRIKSAQASSPKGPETRTLTDLLSKAARTSLRLASLRTARVMEHNYRA